jgi:hypothetical protein
VTTITTSIRPAAATATPSTARHRDNTRPVRKVFTFRKGAHAA